MENTLRILLLEWLALNPPLNTRLNAIVEEAPSRTSLPWLAIATSASVDWSTKTAKGREIRIALELHCRNDQPKITALLTTDIEQRIENLPRDQTDFHISTIQFLRARTEQRGESRRATLLEYRFRVLSH